MAGWCPRGGGRQGCWPSRIPVRGGRGPDETPCALIDRALLAQLVRAAGRPARRENLVGQDADAQTPTSPVEARARRRGPVAASL